MAVVISSTAGTRVEPIDGYIFMRGTTAKFKVIFQNEGRPITVNTGTTPTAKILEPMFLNKSGTPNPNILAVLQGTLVPGQDYEYEFSWDIPLNISPLDEYIVRYSGNYGGMHFDFGDEFFSIVTTPGTVGIRYPLYATVDDVRSTKFNIDDYLPKIYAKDLIARNGLIERHLRTATVRLREELALFKQRGFSENYRLFCTYYTVWSLLLASRGEDGSSVSDQNLSFWKSEWERILAQEKRESIYQGIPVARG